MCCPDRTLVCRVCGLGTRNPNTVGLSDNRRYCNVLLNTIHNHYGMVSWFFSRRSGEELPGQNDPCRPLIPYIEGAGYPVREVNVREADGHYLLPVQDLARSAQRARGRRQAEHDWEQARCVTNLRESESRPV